MTHTKGRLQRSAKPWVPHAYQKKAVKFLIERGAGGLLLDPGLGKSSITLAAFDILRKQKLENKALIIAPLRVAHSVWPVEVEKWSQFEHLKVTVLHGSHKEKALLEDADIYVINFDGLQWLTENNRLDGLIKRGVKCLVIDELSKMKHTNTRRFKLLKPYLARFTRRWGLTGSPAPNGLMDLFGQAYVLDEGRSLGRYITHFRMEYFYQTGYGGYTWTPREGADEAIYERLRPLVLRMDAKDYLDLPEQIVNIIRVDLPDKVRKHYDLMEDEAFTVLSNEKVVTAANAAAAMNKCSQIANGGVYTTEGDDLHQSVEEMHTVKVEALQDLVEELQGQPLLVAYEFKHDIARIQKALGAGVPYIGGGVSAKRAAALEQSWNANQLRVLLGHPASIGHGLNLQGGQARHVCWFGIPWDYELYDQFIRRVLRQGNENDHVTVHHIVARSTVDEAKLKALRGKRRTQNHLLDALKEYRENLA